MKRGALPLNALRAFEAAARLGSFKGAAEELCVTHSAISQQVRQLEQSLGLTLFRRTNRGVTLTAPGGRLLPSIGEAFDSMSTALTGLTDLGAAKSLSVTATPSFATKWLMPRLGALRQMQGDLSINLLPTLRYLDLIMGEADVAIRCGKPPWKGLKSHLLMPIHMSPVCSPGLLVGENSIVAPQDVLAQTLIHADIGGHEAGEEWRAWLAAAGVEMMGLAGSAGVAGSARLEGLSFQDPNLALQAAVDGLGLAMGYLELAEPDIAAGRLVYPFKAQVRLDFSYYLTYPVERAQEPKIRDFARWIRGAAAEFSDALSGRLTNCE
ncbi:MAG: LysR substrate-binding domain-containing protein [Pseudomonadota bacterium]